MKKQADRSDKKSVKKMEENCDKVANLMKTLAHSRRLMLLCYLSQGEKTVGELEDLTNLSQSMVSQFLNRMRIEGLVLSEKRGLFVHYRIGDSRVKKLINALHRLYC